MLLSLIYIWLVILPDNKITDISVLTQLSNLKKIVLANNPIIDYSVIEELKKKKGLDIVI